MSFTASGLRCITPSIGGGPAHFVYTSAEAHAAVDAADFFTNGANYGMKLGDLVDVIYTTGYLRTVHAVSVVDADGNVTISAGTFS